MPKCFYRHVIVLWLLCIAVCSCSHVPSQATAMRRLEALGEIECNDQLPHRPVVRVDLGALPTPNQNEEASIHLNDDDLETLASFPEVEWLSLYNGDITDRGVEHLMHLKRLKTLYLGKTTITDDGLAKLEGLPMLEYLDVSLTHVTKDGVERFRKRRPKCHIASRHLKSAGWPRLLLQPGSTGGIGQEVALVLAAY